MEHNQIEINVNLEKILKSNFVMQKMLIKVLASSMDMTQSLGIFEK